MPMGAGFFKNSWANSETWNLSLVMNEGNLFDLCLPADYVAVGLIKVAMPCFSLLFTYVMKDSHQHSISNLTESMKICFSYSRPKMPPFILLPLFSSKCLIPII
ncbi:hypothetical protein CQW23_17045 [Capsicum baccatum]|uniref:Uncharacterized protein n=1 Tax=Capsicum baccatum TaxID=33114 RepID=A0A2G2WD32_CAPBA|nr:hypothetical protein CQW23_17045 [Capsicum baccatum]